MDQTVRDDGHKRGTKHTSTPGGNEFCVWSALQSSRRLVPRRFSPILAARMTPRPPRLSVPLRWFAAALSGLGMNFAFPNWDHAWLAWIALTPLLAAIWLPAADPANRTRSKWIRWLFQPGPFLLGYVTGAFFFLPSIYWMSEVTGPGWFFFTLYLAVYPAIWAWLMAGAFRPGSIESFLRSGFNLHAALVGAAAWTGLEWIRGLMISGFAWNSLGVALHANLPLIQLAEYGGVGGISFLLVFVNVIAAATVIRFSLEIRAGRLRPHFDFTLTLALVVGLFVFGYRTLRSTRFGTSRVSLRFASVQPAIPQNEKFDPATTARVFAVLERFTAIAIATQPQLLLWPEAATTHGLFFDEANFKFVTGLAQRGPFHFLLGTLDFEFKDDGQRSDFNAAVLLPAGGGDAQIYHKIHLVPFGEFIPFRHSFPPFVWMVGGQVPGDFSPGREPGVFQLPDPLLKIAPLICFEDTVGELTRQPVLRGAQLLVNLTNDGWFNRSHESRQHLANAVFRTVENRRPLIRCANTGVTCVIDEFGRIRQLLADEAGDTFSPGVLSGVVDVATDPPTTFYTRYGEAFSIICLVFSTMHAAISLFVRRSRRSPS